MQTTGAPLIPHYWIGTASIIWWSVYRSRCRIDHPRGAKRRAAGSYQLLIKSCNSSRWWASVQDWNYTFKSCDDFQNYLQRLRSMIIMDGHVRLAKPGKYPLQHIVSPRQARIQTIAIYQLGIDGKASYGICISFDSKMADYTSNSFATKLVERLARHSQLLLMMLKHLGQMRNMRHVSKHPSHETKCMCCSIGTVRHFHFCCTCSGIVPSS